MSGRSLASVMARTLLLVLPLAAVATELRVTVALADGTPLADAVVVADPASSAAVDARARRPRAVMDQRNLQFVPEILVIRTGTSVEFPNSDQVLHQVYSFSGAKKFQLSLYAGRQHDPVVFDKPGLVVLGCNIHDNMIGYIYVTDSPWFGRSDAHGAVSLDLPDGSYTVSVQHPRITDAPESLRTALTVAAVPLTHAFRLQRPLKAAPRAHGHDKRWEDY